MTTRRLPAPWALVLLVAVAPTARAQEQAYNEDWVDPAQVPPAVRASAQRAAPAARFEATYRGRDLAYRLVGSTPDKKVIAVKVAEDGRPIWSRTWTSTPLTRVPRAAVAAVQAEALNSTRVPGFQALKAASVELVRIEKGVTETFFELRGARGDGTPARAEVTAEGVVRRAEIVLTHPTEKDRRQIIAAAAIPPPVRRKALEASPGSTFTSGRYEVELGGRIMVTAIGVDRARRPVEVMVEVVAEPKAETRYVLAWISTQIPAGEMAPKAQAKLRDDQSKLDELKGFQATEYRRLAMPGNSLDPIAYVVLGTNGEGKRLRVFIGHNPSVDATEDRDAEPPPEKDRKFAVLAAKFGIDDRWVDVTEQARAAVSKGRLIGQVAGLPDPAYGTHKVLVVAYTADGRVGLGLARDDQPLRLPPPDGQSSRTEVPPKGFAILAARYGIDETWADVAEPLGGKVADGRLEVANPGSELPDPAVGVHKVLAVAYAVDGAVGLRTARDDRPLALPEGLPPASAPTEIWKSDLPCPTSAGAVGFSPDGKLAFLGGEDGVVRWLDAGDGRILGQLEDSGEGRVDALAVSATGGILVARAGRPLRIWPSKESKTPISLGDYKEPVTVLAFSPKGDQAASGSWDKSARTWDAKTGRLLRTFAGHQAAVRGVAFAAGERQLVTTSWDGIARLWDAATGAEKFKYQGDNGQFLQAFVPRDGKLALTVSDRGWLITWDLASGKVITRVLAPACGGWAQALAPDGRRMADAEQNAAILRDVATLSVATRIERHTGTVKILAFSPDGGRLLTAADDKTARLWKLPEPAR